MKSTLIPFNLELLIPTPEDLKFIKQVKVLDIFEGATHNFHPEGLYSVEIFGKAGSDKRRQTFAYIDLHIPVFHPIMFKAITELKELYGKIMAKTEYAVWDPKLKDFVKSTPTDGETGMSFFLKYFEQIKYEKRNSPKREFNIKLVEKYKKKGMYDKLLVLPAGLRDYEITKEGKQAEHEVNKLYRKVITLANLINPETAKDKDNEILIENTRYSLQLAVNEVYDYFNNTLKGKKKFIQGKWATRRIFNTTRNVITSNVQEIDVLFSNKTISYNQTVAGLYQCIKALLPVTIYQLKSGTISNRQQASIIQQSESIIKQYQGDTDNQKFMQSFTDGFLSKVFPNPNEPAMLVDKKTLKLRPVKVDSSYYDDWMTLDGLETTLTRFSMPDLRHEILEVDDYYLGLIYKGKDGTFKLLQDIDQVPDDRDKKDVYPISFAELLYTAIYKDIERYPCFVTRYPITGFGSIYPSFIYLKTTVKAEEREELNDNWERSGFIAKEFPIRGVNFYNSMSVHPAHTKRLSADHDGDTCSFNVLYTEESIEEIKKYLKSKRAYLSPNGDIAYTAATDINNFITLAMTM